MKPGTANNYSATFACLLAAAMSFLPLAAHAGAPKPVPGYQTAPGDSIRATIPEDEVFNPFGALMLVGAIVVVFSLVLYYGLRFFKSGVYGKGFQGRMSAVKPLGSAFLGPRKSICLVQVLDRLLVLGLGEHEITLLLEIPLADLSEEQKLQVINNPAHKSPDFKKILAAWTKK